MSVRRARSEHIRVTGGKPGKETLTSSPARVGARARQGGRGMGGKVLITDNVATNRIVLKVKLAAACYLPPDGGRRGQLPVAGARGTARSDPARLGAAGRAGPRGAAAPARGSGDTRHSRHHDLGLARSGDPAAGAGRGGRRLSRQASGRSGADGAAAQPPAAARQFGRGRGARGRAPRAGSGGTGGVLRGAGPDRARGGTARDGPALAEGASGADARPDRASDPRGRRWPRPVRCPTSS